MQKKVKDKDGIQLQGAHGEILNNRTLGDILGSSGYPAVLRSDTKQEADHIVLQFVNDQM